jgi:Nitrile hydratase, alpha chain
MAKAPIDWEYEWGQLVAKAWADDAFKKKLLTDPAGVLKEHGLVPPANMTIKVLENTDKVLNLVLPIKPAPEELSEDELHRAAGGHCHHCGCERCGRCGCERCGCERCGCERCRC